MTFASEEVRHYFHNLPTQKQYEWASFDESLAIAGKALHVERVTLEDGGFVLELTVRDFFDNLPSQR